MPIPIRAAILDDERGSIETLQALLARDCPEVDLVATFEYPDVALQELPALAPDLLFLDVEMDDLNGFDVLDALPPDWKGEVVFVTAYPAYAARSYEYAALDYLVKPVKSERLQAAVALFQARRGERDFPARRKVFLGNRDKNLLEQSIVVEGQVHEEAVQMVFKPLKADHNLFTHRQVSLKEQATDQPQQHKVHIGVFCAEEPPRTLIVKTVEKHHVIPLSQILYLAADGAYTWIFLLGGKNIYASKKIGDFATLLTGNRMPFFKIHKSYIVGKQHIIGYKTVPAEHKFATAAQPDRLIGAASEKDPRWVVELPGNKALPIARRNKADFKRWMGE